MRTKQAECTAFADFLSKQDIDTAPNICYNNIRRAISSVGQSYRLITGWSGVRVPDGAPSEDNPNLLPVGDGFGFVFFYAYPNFNSKVDRFVR